MNRGHRPETPVGRTFLMYLRASEVADFHLKAPWIEFPEAFGQIGFRSVVLAGRVRTSRPLRSVVYETGHTKEGLLEAWRELPMLFRVLRTERPSIVMVYASKSLAPLCILASRLGRGRSYRTGPRATVWVNKLDWDVQRHADERRLLYVLRRWVVSLTSHLYDWTTVEGSESLARLSSIGLIAQKRLMLLPIGYPQDCCTIEPYENGSRENVVLCVSRIARQKGLTDLVKAFARVAAGIPEWQLVFVGPVTEPGYLDQLRELVSSLGLEGKVRFPGFLSDVELSGLYHRASIFCLPSVVENAGQVRYEAMASGLPLITTAAGTGRDLAAEGARVVPVADVAELERSLRELMSDRSLRAHVATCQQEHLRSYLDLARELAATLDPDGPADLAAETSGKA